MLKLKSIDNIELQKSDVPLYYIKEYFGDACIEEEGKSPEIIPVSFILEMEPTGNKKISVTLKKDVEFPVLPLLKMLKEEIGELDKKGRLL